MSNKKFILNADDFGMNQDFNRAVLEGYNFGFLRNASICANGEAFESAINEILPECQDLGLAVHLNVIEGKALTHSEYLTDNNGKFKRGYLWFMLNCRRKEVLKEIEREFRAQIEKVQKAAKVSHIDSHVHVHAIPEIFKLTARLAREYNIPYIRTQGEEFYVVPGAKKNYTPAFFINILKILLLNLFTKKNKKTAAEFGLKTNDYLIGVGYTGMMNSKTVEHGLKAIEADKEIITECLIHPCKYKNQKSDSHSAEFEITTDNMLKDTIYRMGYEIISIKNL